MFAFWRSLSKRLLGYYWVADARNNPTAAGAAVCSPLFLKAVYDRLVLGIYCTWAWRCPSTIIQDLYDSTISSAWDSPPGKQLRILDIGVGTGYFLANASLLSDSDHGGGSASITLFDLNPACLEAAASRCRAAHPRAVVVRKKVCGDFLAPARGSRGSAAPPLCTSSATDTGPAAGRSSIHALLSAEAPFDCVFATMVLHCLPGPTSRKAAALGALAGLVEPRHGVLAGATVLGDGAEHNWLGRFLMFWHNALGMFGNKQDDAMSFVGPLREAFADVEWRVVGTVLIFEARGPRQ